MYTTAEIGVALAGFAALVISFRQRQDSSLSNSDRLVVASLVERGLMAAFLSFLPILLFGLGLSERLIWFFSSGTFVAYSVSVMIVPSVLVRSPVGSPRIQRFIFSSQSAFSWSLFRFVMPWGLDSGKALGGIWSRSPGS